MTNRIKSAVGEILESPEIKLTRIERHVLQSIRKKSIVTRDTEGEFSDTRTFGERLSDQVALIGGSWTFVIVFLCILIAWIVVNSLILVKSGKEAFDPYPYILLNLFLSMTTAIQAPIIMMSQNRQAEKDRLQATNDYEVNLKTELEIQRLHEKLDELHKGEWSDMKEIQERQVRFLERIVSEGSQTDLERIK